MSAASAVLRLGGHAPARLLGAPVAWPPAEPGAEPGASVIILGWTTAGEPVELAATTDAWLDDLAQAIEDLRARRPAGAGTAVPA